MLPDRVSNPDTLTYETGTLPIALRGPAILLLYTICNTYLVEIPVVSINEMKRKIENATKLGLIGYLEISIYAIT